MIHQNENWRRDALKCVEELEELSTRIMQQINKPHKNLHLKIQNEIADVTARVEIFSDHYDEDAIEKRIASKQSSGVKTTYNHMFDIAFSVPESRYEDGWDCIDKEEEKVRMALIERVTTIIEDMALGNKEAFGFCDTYEETF